MNSYLASLGPAIANHLWQSTALLAVASLLALALRRSPARVRHTIWVVASAKFLVPFSLLIAAGNLLPHPRQTVAPAVYPAMEAIEEPFAVGDEPLALKVVHTPTLRERVQAILPESVGILWALGAGTVLLVWMSRGRVVRRMRRSARPTHKGRELEILRRVQEQFPTVQHRVLPLRLSSQRTEPGIFGIFLPVLVWPEALSARLDDEHIEAIMAHELAHVRRRDNLTAALHMLVEVLFWFHPLVWWMERQLVREREQACDEAVIEMGGDEETYAESLLKTCRFCLESPLPCVAGVTGGELKQRIHSILTLRPNQLGRAARFTLLTVLLGTIAAPLALGLVHRLPVFGQILKSTGPRPSYEVASIRLWRRPAPAPDTVGGEQVVHQAVVKFSPGNLGGQRTDRVHMITPLGVLVAQAYGLPAGSDGRADGRVVGGPDWMTRDSEQYDIQAKIEDQEFAAMQKMSPQQQREQVNLMNQSLLEERFKLKVHFETRELPAYALVVAKGGPEADAGKTRRIDPIDEHAARTDNRADCNSDQSRRIG